MTYSSVRKRLYPLYRLLCRIPLLGHIIRLIQRIRYRRGLRRRFRYEILVLKDEHKSSSSHQSILFFTTMKCASSYITNTLRRLTIRAGMSAVDFEGYFFNFGKSKQDKYGAYRPGKSIYKSVGYFYGPFREFNTIPGIDDYKVVLALRDPRDVLTSYYFSVAYSHIIPLGNPERARYILNERKKFLKLGIDQSVLSSSDYILKIYKTYCRKLLNRTNVLFFKYEDMIDDFDTWLDRIIDFLQIEVHPAVLRHIKIKADFSVPFENIYSNKRQVTPGDHKRKLKSSTIDILNMKFREIIDILGYPKG